jgi:peptidyl-dipeptidase A
LHAYVRRSLNAQYGSAVAPATGLIPAHLLGNIWAQDWSNVYPLVASKTAPSAGFDVTELLKRKGLQPLDLFKIAERFYVSLGMKPLPETFWQRSLFTKPRDREVVCHASAWSMDYKEDLRVKMCTEVNAEDLSTVHHEEGHLYYDRAYNTLPLLFQTGANDGFHEAIGDAIALSVTPDYLKTIGLLGAVPSTAADTMILLNNALAKVAFLPFGLLVDRWRWGVFSGEIKPADYNKAWWQLRAKYQGVSPPAARTEKDFDPAAKYHVAGNVPYARYFLAAVLQFQFYRAMCREAGWKGPLHRCSVYGSTAAGERFSRMMRLGASKPWPDALYELTGSRELDASAILDYFAPLRVWLDQQNRGKPVGWGR